MAPFFVTTSGGRYRLEVYIKRGCAKMHLSTNNLLETNMSQTTVKYTQGHDRLTITAKFPNGENLRVNSSRNRSSMSCKRPTGMTPLAPSEMRTILRAAEPRKGETFGSAMVRLSESLKLASSISNAAALV